MMRVCSVNLGEKQAIDMGNRISDTGIYKKTVAKPVFVSTLGLEGDVICDHRYHGGPDQAVYIYRKEDYMWWQTELGNEIQAGTFGENLMIEGLPSPSLMVGDQLEVGDVVLEITAPRIPCRLFARRMQDSDFVQKFKNAERPGFYCRVIKEGLISAESEVSLIPTKLASIDTVEFFNDAGKKLSVEKLNKYLALPIDIRSRSDFEKKLAARS